MDGIPLSFCSNIVLDIMVANVLARHSGLAVWYDSMRSFELEMTGRKRDSLHWPDNGHMYWDIAVSVHPLPP